MQSYLTPSITFSKLRDDAEKRRQPRTWAAKRLQRWFRHRQQQRARKPVITEDQVLSWVEELMFISYHAEGGSQLETREKRAKESLKKGVARWRARKAREKAEGLSGPQQRAPPADSFLAKIVETSPNTIPAFLAQRAVDCEVYQLFTEFGNKLNQSEEEMRPYVHRLVTINWIEEKEPSLLGVSVWVRDTPWMFRRIWSLWRIGIGMHGQFLRNWLFLQKLRVARQVVQRRASAEIASAPQSPRQLTITLPDPTEAKQSAVAFWPKLLNDEEVRILQKLKDLAVFVDRQEGGWNRLQGSQAQRLRSRCVEHHVVTTGGALPDPSHFDGGSLFTIDVMLSAPGVDFQGGDFCTLESDDTLRSHHFGKGDALVFLSHKAHCVQPVTSGRRQTLVMELWEGEERCCNHRCHQRWGECREDEVQPVKADPTRVLQDGPRLFAATAFEGIAFFPKVGQILRQSLQKPKSACNVEVVFEDARPVASVRATPRPLKRREERPLPRSIKPNDRFCKICGNRPE
eukprot:g19641.t1